MPHQSRHEDFQWAYFGEEAKLGDVADSCIENFIHKGSEADGPVHRLHVDTTGVELHGSQLDVVIRHLEETSMKASA